MAKNVKTQEEIDKESFVGKTPEEVLETEIAPEPPNAVELNDKDQARADLVEYLEKHGKDDWALGLVSAVTIKGEAISLWVAFADFKKEKPFIKAVPFKAI